MLCKDQLVADPVVLPGIVSAISKRSSGQLSMSFRKCASLFLSFSCVLVGSLSLSRLVVLERFSRSL